jgi:peroxiredoxin
MNKRPVWLAILLSSILGICLLGCLAVGLFVHFAPNLYQYKLENSALKVGASAPDFELTTLDGGQVRLSDLRGRPVLLSFGATWCPDCRVEAPLLEELHQAHPELMVLLVDVKESPGLVRPYTYDLGITHAVLLDLDGKVMESYQVLAIPTEFFIDEEGLIKAKIIETVTPELLAEKLALIGIDP